jgi:hypothetical protein
VWHQNQNAKYLNSLIADKVIVTPMIQRKLLIYLINSDFENGTISHGVVGVTIISKSV